MLLSKDLQTLIFILFISACIWAMYEIYIAINTVEVPEIYDELTVPLRSDIDIELVKSLNERKEYIPQASQ